MVLTAHQPVYLPWLGLFHKISLCDVFCFFDDVQYQPKDWNNRNKIKFSNGSADWLSVPVYQSGYLEKSYLEIEINNKVPWQRKHWKSIELNYKKAAFFDLYEKALRELYQREWQYLSELNYEFLLFFLKMLKLSPRVVRMKEYAFRGAKSDLVLNMCRTLGASTYVFGEQGKNYADIPTFEQAGVKVIFQKYQHPEYPQLHGAFLPNLSIIDLLLNCGPQSLQVLSASNLSRNEVT
jgi:hypothetical protein